MTKNMFFVTIDCTGRGKRPIFNSARGKNRFLQNRNYQEGFLCGLQIRC